MTTSYFFANPYVARSRSRALAARTEGLIIPCWTAFTAYTFDGTNFTVVPMPTIVNDPDTIIGANKLPVLSGRGWRGVVVDTVDDTFWLLGGSNFIIHSLDVGMVLLVAENTSALETETGTVIAADSALASVYNLVANEAHNGLALISRVPYFSTASGRVFTISSGVVTEITPNFGTYSSGLSTDGTLLWAAQPNLGDISSLTTGGSLTRVSSPVPEPWLTEASASYGVAVAGQKPVTLGYAATAFAVPPTGAYAAAVTSAGVHLLTGTDPVFTDSSTLSLANVGQIVWGTSGTQVLAVRPGANAVTTINLVSGSFTAGGSLTVTAPAGIAMLPNGDQALLCLPGSNVVQVLVNTLGVWSLGPTIATSAGTNIFATSKSTAYIAEAGEVGKLSDVGGTWVHSSVATLGFTATLVYANAQGDVFVAGSASGTGTVAVVVAGATVLTAHWTGAATDLLVVGGQVAVLDATNNEIHWFDSLMNTIGTQSVPAGATAFAKTPKSIWVMGATPTEYQLTAPYTLSPMEVGVVGTYAASTWATYTLGQGHVPSAMLWGAGGALYVATEENDLFTLAAATAGTITLTSSMVVTPYNGQDTGVPLGISALAMFNSHLYATTDASGALIQVT